MFLFYSIGFWGAVSGGTGAGGTCGVRNGTRLGHVQESTLTTALSVWPDAACSTYS